jgi:hypothetical protein
MRELSLAPDQIISSGYEILHDIEMLQAYFQICQMGADKLPPVPVMHRDLFAPHFNPALQAKFRVFAEANPRAEYFLLDGSHRTTAACLTHNECPAVLMADDNDVKEMKQLVAQGRVFKYTSDSIEENRGDMLKHFEKMPNFQTTAQKTAKMVKRGVVPEYMTICFKAAQRPVARRSASDS